MGPDAQCRSLNLAHLNAMGNARLLEQCCASLPSTLPPTSGSTQPCPGDAFNVLPAVQRCAVQDLQMHGLDAAIWNERSRYAKTERWPRSAEALEDDLRWLITVGVLRREVDGHGLTSRFR